MAKKQTRKSISVNRAVYARIQAYCEELGIAVAAFAERTLLQALPEDARAGAEIPLWRQAHRRAPAPLPEEHEAPPAVEVMLEAFKAESPPTFDRAMLDEVAAVRRARSLKRRPVLPPGTRMRTHALESGSLRVILESGDRLIDSIDLDAPTEFELAKKRDEWLARKGYQ